MTQSIWSLPQISLRFIPVWQRNFLVWRKQALPVLLGNLADPLIYIFGLGLGIGAMISDIGPVSYLSFIASGMLCASTMINATYEALYSSFTRMHIQRSWDAILNTSTSLDDIVLAELIWAASKAFLAGLAILIIISALGLVKPDYLLWTLPLIFLIGLTASALGLVVTAIAPRFDFFMYYFTLFLTPMLLLSGVFFPVSQLPPALHILTNLLPLVHIVELARPLLFGQIPENIVLHLTVLCLYTLLGFWLSLALIRKRLFK